MLATARADGLGFLAGGYTGVETLAEQIATVRGERPGAGNGAGFGVKLFAPNPMPVDPQAFIRHARSIAADGDRYGVDLTDRVITEDDDRWAEKVDLLLSDPVPMVSPTFGIPEPSVSPPCAAWARW